MENKSFETVELSTIVKYAALDLGEDYTKVKSTFASFAIRGLKEISKQHLRLGVKRIILPIHKNFSTVTLPLDCKFVTYVGTLNNKDQKVPFIYDGKIVHKVHEEVCIEKCSECSQDKDICEHLEVTKETSVVTINSINYTKTVINRMDGGIYYEETTTPVLNLTNNTVEYLTTSKIIDTLDVLNCGCISNTEANINKIKEHCYSCYETCYCNDTCNKEVYHYNIFYDTRVIKIDRNVIYDKVYIEYQSDLPKENGDFLIPEIATETLVAFIKYKANEHKKSISLQERKDMKMEYLIAKKNMVKIMARLGLNDIVYALKQNPRID